MRKNRLTANHILQTLCATGLCASMAISMMPVPMLAEETESNPADLHPTEKTETVYAFADGDGKISKTIVSSWLHDEDGISGIQETLQLKDVKNVKGDEEPQIDGDTYTWSVNGPDVYYQGTAAKQPPVTMEILYKLDGKEIKASALEGKSGHLQTTVRFHNNEAKAVQVNGKNAVLHPVFLAGCMMDLDHEVFSNVRCSQGKTINDGDKEFLLFAALPGLKQTLETAGLEDLISKTGLENAVQDDITIEADVKDFKLPALYAALSNEFDLKELKDIDSMDDLTGQAKQLFEGADQLKDGASQLSDGMGQLKNGIAPLSAAGPQMAVLADGMTQLDTGAGSLAKGVRDYTYGVSQLKDGSQQLYQISGGVSTMRQTINAKGSLKDGAHQLANGLDQLNQQVSSLDASQLSALKEQLDQAMNALQQLSGLLDKDLQTLSSMKQSMNQLESQVQSLAGSIQTSASSIADSVQSDAQKIAANNQKIAELNGSIESSKSSASASIAQAQNELQAIKAANPDLDTTALETALASAASSINGISMQEPLAQLDGINPQDLQTLTGSLQSLQQLSGALDQSMQTLNGLKNDLDTSIQTLSQLKAQAEQITSSDQFNALLHQLEALKQAVFQLDAGAKSLSDGIDQLDDSLGTLEVKSTAAFDQLNAGTSQLDSNSQALVQGADALKQGTALMASSKGQISQLQNGIVSLTSAVDQLSQGAERLAEGADTFDEQGMGKLKEVLGWSEEQLNAFKTICNESAHFNETYTNFAGAPAGAKTKVRYIFKTEAE